MFFDGLMWSFFLATGTLAKKSYLLEQPSASVDIGVGGDVTIASKSKPTISQSIVSKSTDAVHIGGGAVTISNKPGLSTVPQSTVTLPSGVVHVGGVNVNCSQVSISCPQNVTNATGGGNTGENSFDSGHCTSTIKERQQGGGQIPATMPTSGEYPHFVL